MAALALVTAAAFVIVLLVAGPHTGLLPQWLEAVVLALGWAAVIVVPIMAARAAWRRLAARAKR